MSELIERLRNYSQMARDALNCQGLAAAIDEAILALSAAPAPVAAEPVAWLRTIELSNGRTASEAYTDWDLAKIEQERLGGTITELFAAPPAQEGPKGVDATFEDLLGAVCDAAEGGAYKDGYHHLVEPCKALREYFKQCTAQSIPAAIDEEGREALEAAITFFGSFKDYRISAHDPEKDHMAKLIQEAHQYVIEKHIAALERLLAGN